ncbi:MAG TPA: BrnA antitoxin family protein [Stellaceae bacterium]
MTGKKSDSKRIWIDPDDAPELTEEWFASADLYEGGKLIRKGGRPKSDTPKEPVNIRLDADLVAHYRATGPGWQSRVNDALRKAAKLPRKRLPA